MSIDLLTFYLLTEEIEEKLVDSRLQKISQPADSDFLFRFRLPGANYFLYFSLKEEDTILYPVGEKRATGKTPSAFCMMLRKHLEGGKILYVTGAPGDRIFRMVFSTKVAEGEFREKNLIFEMTGKSSNLILLDSEERYIGAFSRRDPRRNIITGQPYEAPPPPEGINPVGINRKNLLMLFDLAKYQTLPVAQMLERSFKGMEGLFIREILFGAGIEPEIRVGEVMQVDREKIWQKWENFLKRLRERGKFSPAVYYEKEDSVMEKAPCAWSPWEFESLRGFPAQKCDSIGDAVGAYYLPEISVNRYEDLQKDLKSALNKRIKKVERRIAKQNEDLEAMKKAEEWKKIGELLLANLYRIPEKAVEIHLEDYYQDPPVEILIKLEPALNPSENAQKYFNKYKKAKRGREIVSQRLELSRQEMDYLESVIYDIDSAEDLTDLESIASHMISEEIYTETGVAGRRRREGQTPSQPRKFALKPGYTALVGRNSRQNDKITLHEAAKDDLWFHARQIPGSHVVLKIQKPSLPVPDEVIYKTAQLAAYYSQAKDSSKVPVDYTPVKNVRKTKGQPAGKVFYTGEKTIFVKPDNSFDMIQS